MSLDMADRPRSRLPVELRQYGRCKDAVGDDLVHILPSAVVVFILACPLHVELN
jgi:hypothetical protein